MLTEKYNFVNNDDLPSSYVTPNNSNIIYYYDGFNQKNKVVYSLTNPINIEYGYKSSNRNTGTDTTYTTTQIETEKIGDKQYKYQYDAQSNITKIQELVSGVYVDKSTYVYDELNQLVRENSVDSNRTYVYTYDNGGNILSKTTYAYTTGDLTGVQSLTAVNYGYGNTNWKDLMTSVNGDTTQFAYDNSGNPTTYFGRNMTWQNGKELASISDTNSGLTTSYQYDADGRRTKKTVNGNTYDYYYVGEKLIYEKRTISGTVTELYYFYDTFDLLTGFRVVSGSTDNYYYCTYNWRGDIEGIYDSTGTLVGRYQYDAWGNVQSILDANGTAIAENSTNPAALNPFRYRGYYYDAETSYYYVGSRYYDAANCRMLNADTSDVLSNSMDSHYDKNLFAYCDNNPVTRIDSNGENWVVIAAVGALAGGIMSGSISAISQYATTGTINPGVVLVNTGAGVVSGFLTFTGITLLASVGINAALGGATYATEQIVTKQKITARGVVLTVVAGAIGGAVGGKGTSAKGLSVAWKSATKSIIREYGRANVKYATKQIARYTAQKTVLRTAAGVAIARLGLGTAGNAYARSKFGY